ncbi:MAG: hypothetical protein LRY51_04905 [Geovibrio sp.]|nr:hypothetical protein [Geovibrio sp.]
MIKKLLLLAGIVCISVFQANAETCVTAQCHADIKKYEVLHAPVEADECTTCHIMDDYEQHISKPAQFKEFSSPAEDGLYALSATMKRAGKSLFMLRSRAETAQPVTTRTAELTNIC